MYSPISFPLGRVRAQILSLVVTILHFLSCSGVPNYSHIHQLKYTSVETTLHNRLSFSSTTQRYFCVVQMWTVSLFVVSSSQQCRNKRSTLASMSVCYIYVFVWFKCFLPFSPEICYRPHATYSFLHESQAQIAHRCLEPELPGDGGRCQDRGGGEERKEN